MKKKTIFYKKKEILKIIKGMYLVYKVTSFTFGPYGRNIIIEREYFGPTITKDGYKVSKEILFNNKLLCVGGDIIKESAKKTNKDVGDGTTTAIITTYNIIKKSFYYISKGLNPLEIIKQIKDISEIVIKRINRLSKKIKKFKHIKNISIISSNNDKQIGKIISSTIKKVGNNGKIEIEENFNKNDVIEIKNGFIFSEGYLNDYFLDNKYNNKIILNKPYILICAEEIKNFQQIMIALEMVLKKKKPILILVNKINKSALENIILNRVRKIVNIVVVKLPYWGKDKKNFIKDISVFSGSKIFSKKKHFFSKKSVKKIFFIKKAIIKKNKTILIGYNNSRKIKKRVRLILKKFKNTKNEYELDKLKTRISKLKGKMAIIKVGGNSDMEIKERKHRFEDSLNSTKNAINSGVLPGGGVCFLKISNWLKKNILKKKKNLGYKIINYVLKKPFEKLMKNAKIKYKKIIKKIIKNKNFYYGYNLKKKKFCNFFKQGIIDSTKVIKNSLINSISISCVFLLSKCLILTYKNIQSKIF
ncbi:chaperonin GroEL [Candidatus Vidania fulgoroideorum]